MKLLTHKINKLIKENGYLSTSMLTELDKEQLKMSNKNWNETIQEVQEEINKQYKGRTARALSKPFIIKKEDFYGTPFNTLLASGDGKRLWYSVTFDDIGATGIYKIESLKKDKTILRVNFEEAINTFNSWDGKADIS